MPPVLRWFPGLHDFAMLALRWWISHTFTLALCLTVVYSILLAVQPRFLPPQLWLGDTKWRMKPDHVHPITQLIEQAGIDWWGIMDSGTNFTYVAAWEYRKRRGRDPPPGFDVWAKAALELNPVIIERFFDRIYKDLAPFWSIEPKHLRFMVYSQPNVIRIRNGRVYHYTNDDDKTNWVETWAKFLEEFADELPDVDIPVNVLTTPRLAVDWEKINKTMEAEQATRNTTRSPHDAISAYSGLKDAPAVDPLAINWKYTHNWQTDGLAGDPKAYWLQYRKTCPLNSSSRDMELNMAVNINASFPDKPNLNFTTNGYISNVTAARDPCEQPYMRGLYGLFVQCEGVSTSEDLMPIFSGSKLPGNNDILLPSPIYLAQEPLDLDKYPRNRTSWAAKANRLFWRGRATGGVAQWDNWWRFQRHRFVQMTDGVRTREFYNDGKANAPSFSLPHPRDFEGFYPDAFQHHNVWNMRMWLEEVTDVAFTDMACTPLKVDGDVRPKNCSYTNLVKVKPEPGATAFNRYKLSVDMDGTTHSSRWLDLLRSETMPIKATFLAEWHDDRLQPWVHYVPMDNSFLDVYGILDYFVKPKNHAYFDYDEAAKMIAERGAAWAEKWLRREDMKLYTWRLLLEYARVMDDQRERLGFVDDEIDRAKKHYEQ